MNRVADTIHWRIGPRSAGRLMAPEEFDALPESCWDDRYRYELIRGVLVVTPPPGGGERNPNDDLGYLLRLHQESHPQGAVIDLTLPEQTIVVGAERRRCDRALWTGLGRIPLLEGDVPSIVVEFVSARRRDWLRDYEEKRREYLGAGVREYWLIDRFRRIMTVFRFQLGQTVTLTIKETETYQTELLPGFILPLARLLAKADELPPKHRRRPLAGGTQ